MNTDRGTSTEDGNHADPGVQGPVICTTPILTTSDVPHVIHSMSLPTLRADPRPVSCVHYLCLEYNIVTVTPRSVRVSSCVVTVVS